MKIFAFFVAVLLSAEAATVPQDVIHRVTVPIPHQANPALEVPAVVVEVTKDHVHNPDAVVGVSTEVPGVTAEVTRALPHTIDVTTPNAVVASTTEQGSGYGQIQTSVVPSVVSVQPVQVPHHILKTSERLVMATTEAGQKVTTVVPLIDDVVTEYNGDTTLAPDTEEITTDVTTNVPEGDENTTDPLVAGEVTQEVVVVTPSNSQDGDDDDSKENKSPEDVSAEEPSSKESNEQHDQHHLLSSIPPFTEGLAAVPSDGHSTTSEDNKPSVVGVPEKTDQIVIRRRREAPVNDLTDESQSSKSPVEDSNESKESEEKKPNCKSNKTSKDESSESNEDSKENSNEDSASKEDCDGQEENESPSNQDEGQEENASPSNQDEGQEENASPSTQDQAQGENESPSNQDEAQDEKESLSNQDESQEPQKPNKVVAVRQRRALPVNDPIVKVTPTGKPKLETNPKVIAEILAQSKNLQKRYKRSIKMEDERKAPPNHKPLVQKADEIEDSAANGTIDPCDLLCTKFEFEPVCASNGLCLHEFSNQCILDTFNCKHPRNIFVATKDNRCQVPGLELCKEEEML